MFAYFFFTTLYNSGVGLEEDTFTGHVLVYDLGNQMLDITLLYTSQGFMRTVCSQTFHGLGGAVLDAALVSLLKEEYRRCVNSSAYKDTV